MKPGLIVGAAVAGALAMILLERLLMRAQRVAPAGRRALRQLPRDEQDAQLREEVRAGLGAWVSHPRAIAVEVQDGIVRVSGQVLATEIDALLMHLTGMRGVYKVHNALSVLSDPRGFGEALRPEAPSPLH